MKCRCALTGQCVLQKGVNTFTDSIFLTTLVIKRSIPVLLDAEKLIGYFATFEREKFCNICLNAYQLIYQN